MAGRYNFNSTPRKIAGGICLLLGLCILTGANEQAPVKAPPQPAKRAISTAHVIRVNLPITGSADQQVKRQVAALIDQADDEAGVTPVLIFEFKMLPNQSPAGSEFGRSYELAEYLISPELNRFRTVAYMHGPLEGHAILPAMACQEIIAASGASLGGTKGHEIELNDVERNAYQHVAERRQTIPAAVALAALESRGGLTKVRTADGIRYTTAAEAAQLKQDGKVLELDTLVGPGELAHFTAKELRKQSFISAVADTRSDLAELLKVSDVIEGNAAHANWNALRLDISGPINERVATRVQRGITDHLKTGDAHLILLVMDSAGGRTSGSAMLAEFLIDLDETTVRTVAFTNDDARGDAAWVAMACQEIVVTDQTTLGGDGGEAIGPDMAADIVARCKHLAELRSRHWSLWGAMFDSRLEVRKFTNKDSGITAYFCEEELKAHDPDAWQQGDVVSPAGEILSLTGLQAESYGLARYVVEDEAELTRLYGVETEVSELKENAILQFVEALAAPEIAAFLLFIGGFALISEFMAPGLSFAGFASGLCFMLYFWSQYLHGTAQWLEILLFVMGVACLALEMFVVPGFGIFGIGGAGLIIGSLVLASQTFILPQNSYQTEQFPYSIMTVAAAGGGVLSAIYFLQKYFDKSPFTRAMVLSPPTGAELEELEHRESLTHREHLLGKRGVTTSPLVPGGKARFGDDLVDVMSDGDVIEKGVAVSVEEVHGNIVRVRALEPPNS